MPVKRGVSSPAQEPAPYYQVHPVIEWERPPRPRGFERQRIRGIEGLKRVEREHRNFSDEELLALVRRMMPGDFIRLQELHREENPFEKAFRALREMDEGPKRLRGRPGQGNTTLGRDGLEREISRIVIRRLFDRCHEALSSSPATDRTVEAITVHLLGVLGERLLIQRGDLRQRYILPAAVLRAWIQEEAVEEFGAAALRGIQRGVHKAMNARRGRISSRALAIRITLGVLESLGVGITERHLETVLKLTA